MLREKRRSETAVHGESTSSDLWMYVLLKLQLGRHFIVLLLLDVLFAFLSEVFGLGGIEFLC